MHIYMAFQFIIAALVVLLCSSASAFVDGDEARRGLPHMPFYHRFSPQAKENAEKSGANWVFPAANTPEYHQLLLHRDLVRHGRKLATAPGRLLTFSQGNMTIISHDALHYALINVGTPSVSHFVALDTGSDLFWLPCECIACAPANSPNFQGLPSLNVYAPSKSSTSKAVTCGSSNCDPIFSICQDLNLPNSKQCAYGIAYATGNTSTSGTIYQDNIHLTPNNGVGADITTPVVLGCGQLQTGSLVDGSGVPDGLIGLGSQPWSVPSVLAQSGLVGDSFSMCFSGDGSGRIVFGDIGTSAITTTPFQKNDAATYPHYNIGIDSIKVGNETILVNGVSLFDTGTTMTFLATNAYQAVIDSFVKQEVYYKRVIFDQVYDVCYETSNPRMELALITFELSGGAKIDILNAAVPYFYATNNTLAGFCLALMDGGSVSIFGANFMLGYNFVFNRQKSTLGFEQSDCYTSDTSSVSPDVSPIQAPVQSPSSTDGVPRPPVVAGGGPAAAVGPGTSAGRENSAGQRISVPLLSVFSLGLLVNFLLY